MRAKPFTRETRRLEILAAAARGLSDIEICCELLCEYQLVRHVLDVGLEAALPASVVS